MTSLRDVHAVIDRLWPEKAAEGWDAPGLVTGDPDASVERILLTVDVVSDTVAEAIAGGHQLLIAHHPLLLRGVTSIAEDGYKGRLLADLIRGGCALVSAHTNADIVADGVSDVIATRLGLTGTTPIVPGADPSVGLGRVGDLPEEVTLGRLARAVADLLPATAGGVRVAGGYDAPVRRVSLCGGAGDSLLGEPAVRTSDVYVTADLRHHPASEAREKALHGTGPALIDVSHWASEWLWLEVAASELREALPTVSVAVSETRTDPWDFAIVH
ncbi:Nif3-like dinuclear metal center hexameric protein [Rathayibacter sp. VKM Ac-2803]|uniref:Nif3-like dinuclear metal center hexameric protein n=1 Tax=Rathayibacter sp. VKM Ac-2803 TaxID=2609256 RepID=UPI0013589DEE|nr:Nif3-like dinuclear metal center hexameric protein [Rathayibacter sp. VKM Ac-2803]MWV49978.1 Nif3-like dinuclear metal center hexameric protein [Rathayibacter sp. VKM Ac-2803]